MANGMDSAKRAISGTWGELWLDNEYVAECYKCQAKLAFNKDEIQMAGSMAVDAKVKNVKGTGSLGLYKTNSRFTLLIGQKIAAGQDVRFTVITKLDDPDGYGAERYALYNVSFDDLTLADWEVGNIGKVEAPFTFTKWEPLDQIGVQ